MSKTILRNALLALTYALLGWGALQAAVPPSYASPLFPSAGVALACLLIYGNRLWPGVTLGSILVELVAANTGGNGGNLLGWVLVPALGATLQALAGAWLTRRLVGFPNPLEAPRPIALFLLVIIPLSCLINASLAIPWLVVSGAIPLGDALFSWWNWWMGDTLGATITVPLVFALLARPAEVWRPRLRSVALPLLMALVMLALVFLQLQERERVRVESQFAREAESLASVLTHRFTVHEDMVRTLERLVSASGHVTRQEWRNFVAPWVERYPGVLNFSWAPLVAGGEREAFEHRMRQEGMENFRILDRDAEGQMSPAVVARHYAPYVLVEPQEGNQRVVGMNVLSHPPAVEALERSRQTGQPMVTAPFRLVQQEGRNRGVVLYQAVMGGDDSRQMLGVISSAMQLDDTIAATLAALPTERFVICLVDQGAPAGKNQLAGPPACEERSTRPDELSLEVPVNFAQRPWLLVLKASDQYRVDTRSWSLWTTLVTGLFLAAMLGGFLLINAGRTRRTAALVDERTAELAAAGALLHAQKAALADAQGIARMGSWVLLEDGGTLDCSDELRRVLHLPPQGPVILNDLLVRLDEAGRPRLAAALTQARRSQGHQDLDCTLKEPADRPETLHFRIASTLEGGRPSLRGTVQNVTEARQAEAHIQFLARYDSLTGLPNRPHWLEHARATLAEARRHCDQLAVLFLDLDNFKMVNDSLGHPVGDRLLSAVVARFSGCLRESDLLARLGGDEFVVLISRFEHRQDVHRVATKLIESLTEGIQVDARELHVSVSIGIALYPKDGEDVDTLLKNADVAMYGAKQSGRNALHFFEAGMNERAVERLEVEYDLRRALDRQELVLHYQPQFDLTRQGVCGVEALVRWQHPVRGMVRPDHFIPIAEESGLIIPMGEWILREACRFQLRLAQGNRPLTVAVNISALQFRRLDFAERVAAIIQETGADPAFLELEITESALMQPDADMLGRLDRIRSLGLTLALDDFGTGYSSLAYLKRLPIQRLKIDRSFVRDLPGDQEDAAIASATLSLARDMGLDVVAEGVETLEQRDFLAHRGCHLIQGYLIAKPMAESNLLDWLEQTSPQTDQV